MQIPKSLDLIQSALKEYAHLRASKIHGFGMFATKAIPKGTWIGEYTGDRLTLKQALKVPPADVLLLFAVGRNTYINGATNTDTRYINHSCAPNLQAVQVERRVFFQALSDIKAGKELTFDYQLANTEDKTDDYTCMCGASTCRGTMSAPTKG